jgi:predicted dehydrogenase
MPGRRERHTSVPVDHDPRDAAWTGPDPRCAPGDRDTIGGCTRSGTMSGVNEIRFGLVGGGPWAQRVHAPALAAHPRTVLAGVWTRRPEVAAEVTTRFGGRAHQELDELLDDVDAVALAVPPRIQGELAVRVAAAGKHLICEKPLAETVREARAVADAVAGAGVLCSIMLVLRHAPPVRDWLAGLPVDPPGPDTTGVARWLSGSLLGGPYAASRWRAEHGALLDIGPHVIDLLDAALGPITAVDWAHRAEPDLWRIGLTHAGGALSTAICSMRMPVDPSEIEFAVFGRSGSHRIGREANAAISYARLLDELVAAIDGTGPPPPLGAAHGLRLQELIEQVQLAAALPGPS